MSGVLCCGNLVVDVLIHPVDRLTWGATTMVESIEQRLGGNGSNTSYALGKLGVRVRTLGMAGRDAGGEFVLARLAGAGVDTSAIRRGEKLTATSTVLVSSAGDRLFLHRMGASAEVDFTPEDWRTNSPPGFRIFTPAARSVCHACATSTRQSSRRRARRGLPRPWIRTGIPRGAGSRTSPRACRIRTSCSLTRTRRAC